MSMFSMSMLNSLAHAVVMTSESPTDISDGAGQVSVSCRFIVLWWLFHFATCCIPSMYPYLSPSHCPVHAHSSTSIPPITNKITDGPLTANTHSVANWPADVADPVDAQATTTGARAVPNLSLRKTLARAWANCSGTNNGERAQRTRRVSSGSAGSRGPMHRNGMPAALAALYRCEVGRSSIMRLNGQ
jgi:hypothetical protein